MSDEPGVVVVHPDRKAQRGLQRVLATTLRPVECVDPAAIDEVAARAAADPRLVVVIDHATARGRPGAPRWIAVPVDDVQPAAPDAVAALLADGWHHVIGAPLPRCADEVVLTVQKLLRGDPVGIDKPLGWPAERRGRVVDDAADRGAVVAEIVEVVQRAGLSDRVASLASVIVDELLANAIWAAPVDDAGGRPRQGDPRDRPRRLAGERGGAPRVAWGCDGRLLALEVVDGWGSLDPAAPGPLIARARQRRRPVDAGAPGDGMGLALAYACCHQLAIAIAPGRRTAVQAILDVRHHPTELGRAASFHLFLEPAPGERP